MQIKDLIVTGDARILGKLYTKDGVASGGGGGGGSSEGGGLTYTLTKSGSTITLTGSDGSTSSVTDANTDTNTTYNEATTSAAGLMSAADKAKLNGIAAGANNYTYTHPSTHPASMITGLPTSLPASDVYSWAKASTKPSYSWNEITGKPSTFTPASHNHTKSQITDFPTSMPASDVPAWAKASSKPTYTWNEITSKPDAFNPTSHTHSIGEITGGVLSGYVLAGLKSGVTAGTQSTAEGKNTSPTGAYSHAEGNNSIASGEAAHAENYNTTASGEQSHAEGRQSVASGKEAHAEGTSRPSSGSGTLSARTTSDSKSITGTTASGIGSHAEGAQTYSAGYGSHAEGCMTDATGQGAHAEGNYTVAKQYQHASGKYNRSDIAGPASLNTQTSGDALFMIGYGTSSARANALRISSGGNIYTAKEITVNGNSADFAEYFEWDDGNLANEDRRGLFVALVGDKIKLASEGDDYIGVVSGSGAIIANAATEEWHAKYITDIFGTQIYQEIDIPAQIDEVTGEEIAPAMKTTQYVINPEYDPNREYVGRDCRKEWAVVGLVGQVVMVDDGTCVAGGRVQPSKNGIGTASANGYRVMKRLDENHIKVLVK